MEGVPKTGAGMIGLWCLLALVGIVLSPFLVSAIVVIAPIVLGLALLREVYRWVLRS